MRVLLYLVLRSISMSTKKLSVGGQAVIEGVMMRGPHKVAVAVRQPDGEIAVDVNPVNSIRDKYPILKKPLLRGVIALFESLYDGIKALAYSAQVSGEEDEQLTGKEMAMTIATSVLLAVGLFIVISCFFLAISSSCFHSLFYHSILEMDGAVGMEARPSS